MSDDCVRGLLIISVITLTMHSFYLLYLHAQVDKLYTEIRRWRVEVDALKAKMSKGKEKEE